MSLSRCAGSCATRVLDSAAAAVAACGPRVIVDLPALEFIDCHALGALLCVQKAARAAGGGVLLAAPRKPVLRVLDLSGLDHVFCVYASVAAAASAGRRPARYAAPQPAAGTAPPGTAPLSSAVTDDDRGRRAAGCAGG